MRADRFHPFVIGDIALQAQRHVSVKQHMFLME